MGSMTALAASLAALAVVIGFGLLMIGAGVRNGDQPSDPAVSITVAERSTESHALTVEVTVRNPGEQVALVGVGLRRSLAPPGLATAERRKARTRSGRRAVGGLGSQVGVVAPDRTARFHICAEPVRAPGRVVVVVGTPGRLRLHSLPLPRLAWLSTRSAALGGSTVQPQRTIRGPGRFPLGLRAPSGWRVDDGGVADAQIDGAQIDGAC